ncbi:MAG: hypothetical protein ACE5GC_05325 [Acidimicrobiia bacterium]
MHVIRRTTLVLGVSLVLGACSGDGAVSSTSADVTTSQAAEVPSGDGAVSGGLLAVPIPGPESLSSSRPAAALAFGEAGPGAPTLDTVAAMGVVDWPAILTEPDTSKAAALAIAEVLRALAAGLPADTASRSRPGFPNPSPPRWGPSPATDDVTRTETPFTKGTMAGTKTVATSTVFDPESGVERTTTTVVAKGTDSATGVDSLVETTLEVVHDVCWGADGNRTGEYTLTGRSDRAGASSTHARGATVTVAPDGTGKITRTATVDGHTATVESGSDDPPGRETVTETVSGDTTTVTHEYENGYKTVVAAPTSTFSESKLGEAVDRLGDEGSYDRDVDLAGSKLAVPHSGPGSREFCLDLTLDPASANVAPDGDTVGFVAKVEDWNERPVTSAIVKVEQPLLGSIAPAIGPTSTEGTLHAVYTSGDPGTELLGFRADHLGYSVTAESTVRIGRGGAIEWTDTKFGNTATVTASSCDGRAWRGILTFGGTPGGVDIDMTARFEFTLAEGETVTVPVESKGTLTAAGETMGIEFVYSLEFGIDDTGANAVATFTRVPGGGITVRGTTVPFPAAGFEEFFVNAPLEPAEGCSP